MAAFMSRKTVIKAMSMDRSWLCRFHHRKDMSSVDGMTMPVIQEQLIQRSGQRNMETKPAMVILRMYKSQSLLRQ